MDNKVLLTLCIPTNGVSEWVFPVLDSIYAEDVELSYFEVIITDNGDNEEFYEQMQVYKRKYNNLYYKKTDAYEFMNQVEAFKLANGEFIKFVNHRSKLVSGALRNILEFIRRNIKEKPVVFYSNGALPFDESIKKCVDFNEFVKDMSYYSSWSGGLSFWKEDFQYKFENHKYNKLFPHTDILFGSRKKLSYYIDNNKIFDDLPVNNKKKGSYLLFKAFGVDYISILLGLYLDGDIKLSTFSSIKDRTLDFIAGLYVDFKILKKPCSYDLSNARKYIKVFYGNIKFNNRIIKVFVKKVIRKFIKR